MREIFLAYIRESVTINGFIQFEDTGYLAVKISPHSAYVYIRSIFKTINEAYFVRIDNESIPLEKCSEEILGTMYQRLKKINHAKKEFGY